MEDLEMEKQTIFELLIYIYHGCDVIYFNSFDNFDLSTTQLKFDDDRSWFLWSAKITEKALKRLHNTHNPMVMVVIIYINKIT